MMQVRLWLLLVLSCNLTLQTIIKYQKAVSSEAVFFIQHAPFTKSRYHALRHCVTNFVHKVALTS